MNAPTQNGVALAWDSIPRLASETWRRAVLDAAARGFRLVALTALPAPEAGRFEKLALLARGREFEPFDRSLDVQVSRLRKLVEVDAASPRYIQTVWGVGYVFVPDGTN